MFNWMHKMLGIPSKARLNMAIQDCSEYTDCRAKDINERMNNLHKRIDECELQIHNPRFHNRQSSANTCQEVIKQQDPLENFITCDICGGLFYKDTIKSIPYKIIHEDGCNINTSKKFCVSCLPKYTKIVEYAPTKVYGKRFKYFIEVECDEEGQIVFKTKPENSYDVEKQP